VSILRSLILAIAFFTRIPLPAPTWERPNMRHVLAALPVNGIILALLLAAWFWACEALAVGVLLFAAGLTLIPVLLTGGIHLDGFCDTIDALSSRATPERKRAILKDPHVGAFAIISIVTYLLAYFALCTELERSFTAVLLLGLGAVMSRALAGFVSLTFPVAKGSDILNTLRDASTKQTAAICALWFFLAVFAGALMDWRAAVAMAIMLLLLALYAAVMARRQFGGMSGDLAGYLITLAELGAVIALVLVEKMVVIL
jgi:adenosylcobinamide-GDP ribazoletransferase